MSTKIFQTVHTKRQRRNGFNLTHDHKLSCNMGTLVPVMVEECLPGDTWHLSGNAFVRTAPLRTPVMHRVNSSIHYWFVPNRIVWPNFYEWMADPSSNIVPPYLNFNGNSVETGTLSDYMGIPPNRTLTQKINAIPFAAYQMIYNQRYRDQNLIPEVDFLLQDGAINRGDAKWDVLVSMRNRSWMHDYFTSALPFAQRGPAVDIPLGEVTFPDTVPVVRNSNDGGVFTIQDNGRPGEYATVTDVLTGGITDELRADLRSIEGQVAPTSVSDLRRAIKLQEWLELSARTGQRPREFVQAFFDVDPGDARLNEPEYITGVTSPVVINEIANTTGEVDGLPQGNLAGRGVGVSTGKVGKYFCLEHGYIIGVLNIQPIPAYQDGVAKHLCDRFDQFKYFFRQMAHIGEQEILNAEIFCSSDSVQNNGTFGYTPRYAEYRDIPSRVSGEFRDSLKDWHFARKFANLPTLSAQFVEAKEGVAGSIPTDPFAVTAPSVEKMYVHILNNCYARRPIPVFGTPAL